MTGQSLTEKLARRAVERTVEERQAGYARDMGRIVEATYRLIERTGTLDPSMRDILAETGLSTQGFYRYFQSKDELMLAVLDDGRRRLVETLRRRMERVHDPAGKVRAWIEGVLAQAGPTVATRTRPWMANEHRLAERFPTEHAASVELLVALVDAPLAVLRPRRSAPARRADAVALYRLTFATLLAHLAAGTRPAGDEVDHVVSFCLRGVGG